MRSCYLHSIFLIGFWRATCIVSPWHFWTAMPEPEREEPEHAPTSSRTRRTQSRAHRKVRPHDDVSSLWNGAICHLAIGGICRYVSGESRLLSQVDNIQGEIFASTRLECKNYYRTYDASEQVGLFRSNHLWKIFCLHAFTWRLLTEVSNEQRKSRMFPH